MICTFTRLFADENWCWGLATVPAFENVFMVPASCKQTRPQFKNWFRKCRENLGPATFHGICVALWLGSAAITWRCGSALKVLKLYAWEPSFESQVLEIRQRELRLSRHLAYYKAFSSFLWNCTPFIVSHCRCGNWIHGANLSCRCLENAFFCIICTLQPAFCA